MNASKLIDKQIADLGGWRGKVFARLRKLINAADPGIVEDWKWNTAVWNRDGMVCAVGGFKDHVKLNFFKGASLADPRGLFNAGLEAKTTRAVDFNEGNKIDEPAIKNLVRAAIALNQKTKVVKKGKDEKTVPAK